MSDLLFQKFDEKIELTDAEKELSFSFFIPKKLRKKQYLLQQGEVCEQIAFVKNGLLRLYKTDSKGHEHITQFAFEGWWISDQLSFITGEPSEYNIDALEDSELLLLTRQAEEEMLEKIPRLERFFRILLQRSLIAAQKRLVNTFSQTAEERYSELMEACPESMPNRVPQHMLASFLGITPETLSRIRRKIATHK